MTLSLALNNALSGLQANTRQAEVISTNVANALTEGFGRRGLSLSPGAISGVRVDGVVRASAPALTEARRFADASASAASVLSDAFTWPLQRMIWTRLWPQPPTRPKVLLF